MNKLSWALGGVLALICVGLYIFYPSAAMWAVTLLGLSLALMAAFSVLLILMGLIFGAFRKEK